MRKVGFILSLLITFGLVYFLNSPQKVGNLEIPPLGSLLNPFQGFWANQDVDPEDITLIGLRDSVTIVYDSLSIPHIFAKNDGDLYFAQGYLTATMRLWQMEFQTHAAAGRLSEILGLNDNIQEYDRRQRRLGMVTAAKQMLELVEKDPVSREMLNQYTNGVNAWITKLKPKDLPFEYKLLGYQPEPWTNLKSILLLKSMAQTLNMGDRDMEMTNTLKRFGPEVVALLFPDREHIKDDIVENPGKWNFKPVTFDSIPLAVPDEYISIKRIPNKKPGIGSNNWAVSGSKTTTGSPILCGDPHLDLSLPSIWFAAQLHAPGVNTMGVSLPGLPGIVIGFNDSIAWSLTNAQRDLIDWYKIKFKNDQRKEYEVDGKWLPAKKVVEEIKIKGQPSFFDTVTYTQWGPIVYDKGFMGNENRADYAFRWISHDPSNELITLYLLNRSKNHSDYMKAMDNYHAPAQNFVFASVSGDIAMRIQGKFPVRRHLEGKFVLDGSKSSEGWQAFIPFEQNVMIKNPARGFVSSANQHPVDSTYPYYVTADYFEAYRNRRINEVLQQSSGITPEAMMKLQHDNFSLKGKENLPLMLSYLNVDDLSPEAQSGLAALKSWDYYNSTESLGASYFETWWDLFHQMTWDEFKNDSVLYQLPTEFTTSWLLKYRPTLSYFDVESTPEKENLRIIINQSFRAAIDNVEHWKTQKNSEPVWGTYKGSYLRHLLRIEPLGIPLNSSGGDNIVNAHTKTHGPSWRMVVSLEKSGIKAWGVYPGGQSGNPGSVAYSNMVNHWVTGKYFRLDFLTSTVNPGSNFKTIKLSPVK